MKAFTDINQSKKLAEILPINSADMCWGIDDDIMRYSDKPYLNPYKNYTAKEYYIPCWSFTALLDFLAQQDCFPEIIYTGTCYLMNVNFYNDEEGKIIHPIYFIRTEGNTLIDACV